ncbi:hypothetical protein TNCT_669211 [Trichonephila clavata]|uniref:Uncharacterized protein n=1 Tax=Trichonephila clavata TaxID=2740835 RepID=A0A8X6JAX0_TRICU|nr:hypothetical protein TNCT_669211 [Trichonephila clavata]
MVRMRVKYNIFGSDEIVGSSEKKKAEMKDANMIPAVKHDSVMPSVGCGNLVYIADTMNQLQYRKMLQDNVLQFVDE